MDTDPTENPDTLPEPIPPYVRGELVRSVYRSSLVLTVGATLALLFVGVSAAISFLMGCSIALLFFWALERTLQWVYTSRRKRRRAGAIFLTLGKYVVLGILLYQFVRWNWIRIGYFSFGICILYFGVVAQSVLRLCFRRQIRKLP